MRRSSKPGKALVARYADGVFEWLAQRSAEDAEVYADWLCRYRVAASREPPPTVH
jgi:alkanesulfonate monooxygenase SsuD/methylene tetrahydromethanopterin reductase-like flavin-dependent oxidoreductase (luciferase family)